MLITKQAEKMSVYAIEFFFGKDLPAISRLADAAEASARDRRKPYQLFMLHVYQGL